MKVLEYWLVDAREADNIEFEIYKRGKKEFVANRRRTGWVKSSVLGKAFRLVRSENLLGNSEFTLEIR